jgi:hypothetical protein
VHVLKDAKMYSAGGGGGISEENLVNILETYNTR